MNYNIVQNCRKIALLLFCVSFINVQSGMSIKTIQDIARNSGVSSDMPSSVSSATAPNYKQIGKFKSGNILEIPDFNGGVIISISGAPLGATVITYKDGNKNQSTNYSVTYFYIDGISPDSHDLEQRVNRIFSGSINTGAYLFAVPYVPLAHHV